MKMTATVKQVLKNLGIFAIAVTWGWLLFTVTPPLLTSNWPLGFTLLALCVIVPGTLAWYKIQGNPPKKE